MLGFAEVVGTAGLQRADCHLAKRLGLPCKKPSAPSSEASASPEKPAPFPRQTRVGFVQGKT